MKKSIIIIILSVIIAFIIYKAMVPSVITARKANRHDIYSNTVSTVKDNVQKEENDNYLDDSDYYDEEQQQDEFDKIFDEYRHKKTHSLTKHDRINYSNPEYENQNTPIRFKHPKLQEKYVNENFHNDNIINKQSIQDENPKVKPSDFERSVKDCKPYKEEMSSEYMGINIDYKIEILGWIDNRCVINFTSKMKGIGQSFTDQYGITPEDAVITSFAPNIRCEFSKEQLLYVGDSILQEKERNNGLKNNMLKNPNQIVFPEFENMTAEDMRLLQVIFGNQACKILNLEELKNMIKEALELYY